MSVGRPTKLTPETRSQIVEALRCGCFLETAAQFAGIHPSTLHAWLRKAAQLRQSHLPIVQEDNQRHVEFHEAVEKAMAEAEIEAVKAIDDAANRGDWRAAAWRLERKHHDRWGRKIGVADNKGDNFLASVISRWKAALEHDCGEGSDETVASIDELNSG